MILAVPDLEDGRLDSHDRDLLGAARLLADAGEGNVVALVPEDVAADFAPAGATLLSLYNPELLYVEANLEETRLPGVAPGNPVRVEIDAFAEPFRGRVVWINKSTGAQFALMPRNVVSGEFTRVVQRVPVRIWIERDDRWPMLRAGLSARVAIARGEGDRAWAAKAARELAEYETRYNLSAPAGPAPPP